jgi:hypothetical protein
LVTPRLTDDSCGVCNASLRELLRVTLETGVVARTRLYCIVDVSRSGTVNIHVLSYICRSESTRLGRVKVTRLVVWES